MSVPGYNHVEHGQLAVRALVWAFRGKPGFQALRLPTDCILDLLIFTRKKLVNRHPKDHCEGQGRPQSWQARKVLVTGRLRTVTPAEKKSDLLLGKPEALAVQT
jgi:hypothetical protein